MDQKIRVKVGNKFHIYAESDISLVPAIYPKGERKEIFVEVTDAGKTVRGTVSASEAKKLLPETTTKHILAKIQKEEEENPIRVIEKPRRRD